MGPINDAQKYFTLPDGAKLAYDLHGENHLNKKGAIPFVLIGGVSTTKVDWKRLLPDLSKTRASKTFPLSFVLMPSKHCNSI